MKILISVLTILLSFVFWNTIFIMHFFPNSDYSLLSTILLWSTLILFFIIIALIIKKLFLHQKLQYQINLINEVNALKQRQKKNIELSIANDNLELEKKINQLNTVLHLLKNNNFEDAKNSFNDLYVDINSKENINYCNNSYINAILYNKKSLAKQFNIIINHNIKLPEKDDLDIIDLPTIVFNILDNAIEACKYTYCPQIYLNIKYNDRYISIYQKNTNDKKNNEEIRGLHGYGLTIIEEIVKKYDGTCHWQDFENYYESIIMIKYKKEDFSYEFSNN